MARGTLVVRRSICTGCRLCELVCSLVKERESNPSKSRIWIEPHPMEGVRIQHVCLNCGKPPCIEACQREALVKDESTGWVVLSYDKCNNCGQCVPACPLGALRVTADGKVIKCDLCGGSPECVKTCEIGAIRFVERER